jgi:hypothetical protein
VTLFEYVSVMVSIVLALGVSHLLDAASRILRERSWRDLDPLFSVWFLIQVGVHFEVWWALWSYKDMAVWSYMSFVYVIIGPVLLVINNGILVPSHEELRAVSLDVHFYAMKTRIMGVWLLFVLWSLLLGVVVTGRFVEHASSQVLLLCVVLLTLFTRNRLAHLVAGVLLLLFFSAVVVSTRFLPG